MYAIKPTGKVQLIGRTVGSLAMGIAMRWRETDVEIVDRVPDPFDELTKLHRRCVIPENTLKLLGDLGVTMPNIYRHLTPVKAFKFVSTADLNAILREGKTYHGCSPLEPTFHIPEGMLLRQLRSEFMRFGGSFVWDTEAYDAYESNDGSETWTLRRQYGPGANSEMILCYAKNPEFHQLVIVDDPQRLMVLFDVRTGVCDTPSKDILALLGTQYDTVIAVGRGAAVHLWQKQNTSASGASTPSVAWRCILKGRSDASVLQDELHPTLRELMETSKHVVNKTVHIPATTPAIRDDVTHHRISILGDALLPVDPFEWRGDRARVAIEESSALCRLLYGKKYHRGHAPTILRGFEQDAITRRANLLRRDLEDAEVFLAVHPELPREEDDVPLMKRVGA